MYPYSLTRSTDPTATPVTLAEAQVWARVEDFAGATPNADTDLLWDLVQQGIAEIEDRGIALATQTWDLELPRFPPTILLPKAPVQSVSYIKYYNTSGTLTTLSSSNYTLYEKRRPPQITPAYGVSWPATRSLPNAVQVRFVAGWTSGYPERLRQFVKAYVDHHYWHRGEAVPEGLYRLLDPFVLYVGA